eukprot:1877573-Prorocentrum_lima.AAC.1
MRRLRRSALGGMWWRALQQRHQPGGHELSRRLQPLRRSGPCSPYGLTGSHAGSSCWAWRQ